MKAQELAEVEKEIRELNKKHNQLQETHLSYNMQMRELYKKRAEIRGEIIGIKVKIWRAECASGLTLFYEE